MSRTTRTTDIITAVLLGMVAGAAAVLFAAPRLSARLQPTRIGQADILIERTSYDGHVEYSGYLTRIVYGANGVLIEFADDTDALFHGDFEEASTCR